MKNGPRHCEIINTETFRIPFVLQGWSAIKVSTKPETCCSDGSVHAYT